MKIVIPTNNKKGLKNTVAEHFGRCDTYTFLDEKGKEIEIVKNTSEHMGGKGLPPELMKEYNANVLLCKGLGLRAFNLCQQFGIDVYICKSETVQEIYGQWKKKKIKKAGIEDICEEHKI